MKQFKTENAGIKWFSDQCRKQRAFVQKINMRFSCGFPDLFVAYEGQCVFYEFKRTGNTATPLQWETLRRMNQAGVSVYVVTAHSDEEFLIQGPTLPSVGRRVKPTYPLLWLCRDVEDRGPSTHPGTSEG
jgi:hypothetical protein